MSDELLYPWRPGAASGDASGATSGDASSGEAGSDGAMPAGLAPLDDLLRRDGMLWREGAPDDRRLAQLARQLATYAGPGTLPDTEPTGEDDTDLEFESTLSGQRLSPRMPGRLHRWRAPATVAAAVVIVGLLATLLHGLAGSRTGGAASIALAGDCSSPASSAPAQVNWPQFGFGASGGRCKPHETRLSPGSASRLKRVWSAPGQFIDSSPAVVAGHVYVASIYPDSKLYAVDAATGQMIWATPDGQPVETSSTSPAVADGMVLLGVGNSLEAFDATSGRLAWKYTTSGIIATSPAVADGVVYVAFQDQNAYAFDIATGKQVWRTPLGDIPVSGPLAVANHLVYVSANALYALDRATGVIRWYAGGGPLNAPVVAGDTVYVSDSDSRIRAFQAESGASLWTTEPLRNVVSSPISVMRGIIYTGDANGSVWVFDAKTGARKWSTRLPDSTIVLSSPAIANGVVYVTGSCDCGTSAAHFIFALRANDGRLLWQFAPGYPVYTSPVVADGSLYVATYTGLDAFSTAG